MAEMMVSDFARSLAFWTGPLGFAVAFERPGASFACLMRPEGGQVMIYQRDGDWETGPMEPPFGRGAVIQVYVADAAAIVIVSAGAQEHDIELLRHLGIEGFLFKGRETFFKELVVVVDRIANLALKRHAALTP